MRFSKPVNSLLVNNNFPSVGFLFSRYWLLELLGSHVAKLPFQTLVYLYEKSDSKCHVIGLCLHSSK